MTLPDLTRRRLLGAGLGTLAAGALAACGSDPAPAAGSPESEAPAGPWTWTDDLGQKVELDRAPTRIAAYGDAGAALWRFGITPVAMFTWMPPGDDVMFDGLDLDETEIVGSSYGEISLEQLAAARPELIVATTYDGDSTDTMYGFKDKTQLAKVKQIAPVVAVEQTGSMVDVIATNERLVASLGVDTGAGSQVAEDKAAFAAASKRLSTAAGRGLTVVPIFAETDNLYVAKAPDDPALRYYRDQGVRFLDIGGKDYYWQILSWENADTYQPDIFLNATRNSMSLEQLGQQPTFARLGAYRADQVHAWASVAMDYPSQAAYMDQLAGWLTEDPKV